MAASSTPSGDPLWYKDAVIYQLHVKAFFDSTGDGTGDFQGLIQKLDYLEDLGVNCLWLLPFYPSPLRDDGYDIADFLRVHPAYGTLRDVRQLIREAHRRGIRIVTELVINHTSDQHPWFQAARRAPSGSTKRNYYVWSDTDERYHDARIIFKDFERSNWSWDPIAKAYYWHRFFHHQPDLNFDNPRVRQVVLRVMRYWFDLGVDGLRLDAVPYLIERAGTNCENLPETHAILKQLRAQVDARYADRMLLAEANQWPADVLPYFGDGDECHMAFHFPLMPRIFMALRQEDRHPIVEIMRQTPEIPPECQWALFLRNHDELTLEMVTEQERDYMYREYAADPLARINLGIRRRLAPLLENSRRRIELLNSLLFSFPGTPVIYYGDEIGMGDNLSLGDRNGVRTPMQWSADRNGGFSRADFSRLYLPPIMDPLYAYDAVNVEAQQRDPSSLLNWMKRTIALRKNTISFSRGTIEFLHPKNRKILAYVRRHDGEAILAVANLSRYVQPAELDLSRFEGLTPVELFGRVPFPPIGAAPYFMTLGPHSFFWLRLSREAAPVPTALPVHAARPAELPEIAIPGDVATLMEGPARSVLERLVLPWFCERLAAARGVAVETVSVRDWALLSTQPGPIYLALVKAYYASGDDDLFFIPLAAVDGSMADDLLARHSSSLLARIKGPRIQGVLCDGFGVEAFWTQLLAKTLGGAEWRTQVGKIQAVARKTEVATSEPPPPIIDAPPDASIDRVTVRFGSRLAIKAARRVIAATDREAEILEYLTQDAGFDRVPQMIGTLEYQPFRASRLVLARLYELGSNQSTARSYFLEQLGGYYERAALEPSPPESTDGDSGLLLGLAGETPPAPVDQTVGAALSAARQLGRRTAELHAALAKPTQVPAFASEPLATIELDEILDQIKSEAEHSFAVLNRVSDEFGQRPPDVERLQAIQGRLIDRLKPPEGGVEPSLRRFRCHGDYRLENVLWAENDFLIAGFPDGVAEEFHAKTMPFGDLARMLSSFSRATYSGLARHLADRPGSAERLAPWARTWRRWIQSEFLSGYFESAPQHLMPADRSSVRRYLEWFLIRETLWALVGDGALHPEVLPACTAELCDVDWH